MPRVLTFGTFDCFHPGHSSYLAQAAALGELFVVVARDSNVLKIKKITPTDAEGVRLAHVQAAFPQATVLLGNPDDFLAPVRAVKPDFIALGYDQTLPPGVKEADLGAPIVRLEATKPDEWKSSLLRSKGGSGVL